MRREIQVILILGILFVLLGLAGRSDYKNAREVEARWNELRELGVTE